MDGKYIGVGGQALPSGELVEIEIDREIETSLEGGALLESAAGVSKHFSDIGRGEFYAEALVRIGQQAERALGNRAFAGVGVCGLILIGLLRTCGKRRRADEGARPNPSRNWSPSFHGSSAGEDRLHHTFNFGFCDV